MTAAQKQLLFSDVDGLAFLAARGKVSRISQSATYVPQRLGPLLELLHLCVGGLIPRLEDWLASSGAASMIAALQQARESWVTPVSQDAGFIRAARRGPDGDSRLTGFLMNAKRAGHGISGLTATVAGQLVAAMQELENNIHEHSEAPETGIIAYKAEPAAFEFVVADHGIGILRSLRGCAAHASLSDEGKALRAALTDGVSRHGPTNNHGYGFRPIFTGLVNLHGELRFRSGDHAVMMDGTTPELATAQITQKAPIDGFFASVTCHARQL